MRCAHCIRGYIDRWGVCVNCGRDASVALRKGGRIETRDIDEGLEHDRSAVKDFAAYARLAEAKISVDEAERVVGRSGSYKAAAAELGVSADTLMRTTPDTAPRERSNVECKRGHVRTPANTYITPKGSVVCRECVAENRLRRHAAERPPRPCAVCKVVFNPLQKNSRFCPLCVNIGRRIDRKARAKLPIIPQESSPTPSAA